MSRPLRIPVAGGIYHVTSRGNDREAIYRCDADRNCWIETLSQTCIRANWRIHAWCQMGNHYHLVTETPEANLSIGMRHLNGVYTQRMNRRYGKTGHLFQGRFHAVLIERQTHLLEAARYVVLNPVRAKIVDAPEAWEWSSYRAIIGRSRAPLWLETDWTLSQFGSDRFRAIEAYARFVHAGTGATSGMPGLISEAALGRDEFVNAARQKGMRAVAPGNLTEIRRAHRRARPLPLLDYQSQISDPREAMARAYASGGYSMREIAQHFGVHRTTVASAVRQSR